MMDPDEFCSKMILAAIDTDIEQSHINMDDLMCDLLCDLGYDKAVEVFRAAVK